ncbi:hypothetical protein RF11_09203 [Thelohanellus kitauei]|uniref:Uncharacterized protein n=1 Tax=Thelohanellus kitauei TaxID=669202 RepID=A0A0C2NB84_THEKT|nr:hypothetical protein RF11_09203 [Thelohanellus kitauei]
MSTQPCLPGSLECYVITSIGEFLIICGNSDGTAAACCNQLWMYNTISDIWTRHQPPMEFFKSCCSPKICTGDNNSHKTGIYFHDICIINDSYIYSAKDVLTLPHVIIGWKVSHLGFHLCINYRWNLWADRLMIQAILGDYQLLSWMN